MECVACGGTEYQCVDSAYYCAICQTLSQNYGQATQMDECEVYPNFMQSKTRIMKSPPPEKKKLDIGRPWKTHEAYQILLKEQVQALIKLGVDPKLEDVTFKLWVLLLQKLGIAFLSKQPDKKELKLQRIFQKPRDKYHSVQENLKAEEVGKIKNLGFNSKTQNKSLGKPKPRDEESSGEDDELEQEEFYEGDNPDEITRTIVDEILEAEQQDKKLRDKFCSDHLVDDEGVPAFQKAESKDLPRLQRKRAIGLKQTDTIALIYIALQYVNNRILPHDLIRWIKQDKIPFNKLELPDDMKFFGTDNKALHGGGISWSNHLFTESTWLASYLKLKELPEVNIVCIVHRFIVELGLPGELHTYAANLIQMKSPNVRLNKTHCRTNLACLAMAYIIVTLKMIFGLNDETEWKLSKYGQVLSSYIDFEPPLFIWNEWVSHAEKNMSVESSRWLPRHMHGIRDVNDVESVFSQRDLSAGNIRHSINNSHYTKVRCDKRKEVLKRLNSFCSRKRKRSNSADDLIEDDFEDTNGATDSNCEETSAESSNATASYKREIFHNSTFQYVTEPEIFLKTLGQKGINACNQTQSQSSDTNSAFEEVDSADGSFPSQKQNRLKKPGTSLQEIVDNLPFLPKDMPKAYESYSVFKVFNRDITVHSIEPCMEVYPTKVATRSLSYDWLLDICSSHIMEKPATLDLYVQSLELVFIRKSGDLSTDELGVRRMFTRRCFKKSRK